MSWLSEAAELGRRRAMTSVEQRSSALDAEAVRRRATTEAPAFEAAPASAAAPDADVVCPACRRAWDVNADDARFFARCCGRYVCARCTPIAGCPLCESAAAESREDDASRLRRLAEDGHPAGTHELAKLYASGDGHRLPSYTEAFRLYKAAAELGVPAAMVDVGIAYEAGRGVSVDKRRAVECYKAAAARGDATGACRLARCHTRAPPASRNRFFVF